LRADTNATNPAIARIRGIARLSAGKRLKAGLTQQDVADKLERYQSFIATVESGQRRIDVVELLDLAEAIGFDPREAIIRLLAVDVKPRSGR